MPYQRQLAVITLHLCGREAETVHIFLCMPNEVPCVQICALPVFIRSRYPTRQWTRAGINHHAAYNLDAGLRSYVNFKDT